jgi:cyclopropane fatty-acyl-phospholipid synthase-like methyltransferase
MNESRRRLLILAGATSLAACAEPAAEPRTSVGHDHKHHQHGDDMPLRFEKADEWAKIFDDPERDAWQRPDEVVQLLSLSPGMAVADIGAGTGYFLGRLSRGVGREGRVIGIDVEEDMVRYMKERAARDGLENVEAVLVPFDDPKLAPGSVDRILIVDTWHHIGSRKAYTEKLAAALRPGGFVAVVDFTMETDKGPPKEHRIPPEQAVKELEAGGLAATVVEETLPDQYLVKGMKR